ncbi:MAG: methylthioribulose 1-phosphate dehydratase [Firmicutes bacterium]|nr:methylthioribulose 1-phosphate dehydratase [Bacillota bacterium]
MSTELDEAPRLCELAKTLGERGWLPATSGNLSVIVTADPLTFAVTRSGADKSRLTPADLLTVDADARVLRKASHDFRPSAEACVHAQIYTKLQSGAVLHVHTLANNLCSDLFAQAGAMIVTGHELLKALDHWEKEATIAIPIVPNHHDLQELAAAVGDAASASVPGVLVRNHGIYAWGDSLESAFRHLEAFEFLFAYEVMRRTLTPQSLSW